MDMRLLYKVMQKGKSKKVSSWKNSFFSKNHKGLSGIITAVIMIALAFALVAIVWVVVDTLVRDRLHGVESCLDVFGKVEINSRYTCYDYNLSEFHFSIDIGDINVEKVLVSVSGDGQTKSYEIPGNYSDVKNYGDGSSYGEELILPGKTSGLTYVTNASNEIDSIKIAPIIDGEQCEVSDSLSEIDNCLLLA